MELQDHINFTKDVTSTFENVNLNFWEGIPLVIRFIHCLSSTIPSHVKILYETLPVRHQALPLLGRTKSMLSLQ